MCSSEFATMFWAMPYLYKYVSNKEMNPSQSANHRAFQAGSWKELKYNGAPKELQMLSSNFGRQHAILQHVSHRVIWRGDDCYFPLNSQHHYWPKSLTPVTRCEKFCGAAAHRFAVGTAAAARCVPKWNQILSGTWAIPKQVKTKQSDAR